ncbi:breast carcinoma amplified sequence 2 [Coniochaeta ligniaria NRRL 30616]|uniref:Breast carcinoma amplified sequence 2 n=1 Tax=Coniochaeta ligniaria NRRL 30616 TaxID=1408157 RepID=A0A1J7JV00_9PEZI|nr:breast carcinoma amplified sequence 2 [Coniochaeta ligniaria NRRL 30616]
MPAITTIHESLPYIDPEPTPAQRRAAEVLISAERALIADDPHHALLPPPATPNFTPAIAAELERVAAKKPLNSIDLSRYEAQDTPSPNASKDELAEVLRKSYASATYLSVRRAHLALLDSYGKNAWLVGNYQLEAELKALERELAEAKREIDVLAVRRRRAQDEVAGEIQGLEDTWKKGVGRVLETEVATEALRREVLEARRRLA